ncbi:MAG: TIGR00725 family protein [candidate division WOR-3 bacterium]|nr:TIGR00725 family protein [candidate division WOR-3 bacterium]
MQSNRSYIGIIGGSDIAPEVYSECIDIGRAIGPMGYPVICGGLSGVMEAVSRGVKQADGLTVGLTPGDKNDANKFIDISIGTGIGISRNLMIIRNSDIVIAIDGRYGTLSEIAFALQLNKPIIAYRSDWSEKLGLRSADSIEEIAKFIEEHL